jgi:hypothetical protein
LQSHQDSWAGGGYSHRCEGFVFCAALGFSERAPERRCAYSRGAPRGGGCTSRPTHLLLNVQPPALEQGVGVSSNTPAPIRPLNDTRARPYLTKNPRRVSQRKPCAHRCGGEWVDKIRPLPTCRKRRDCAWGKRSPTQLTCKGRRRPTPDWGTAQ